VSGRNVMPFGRSDSRRRSPGTDLCERLVVGHSACFRVRKNDTTFQVPECQRKKKKRGGAQGSTGVSHTRSQGHP